MYNQTMKDGKIVYKDGSTKTIPYGTEVLAPGADKLNAVRVEMPDSITVVAAEAFWACMELEEVSFSKNLKEIQRAAFCYCKNLKHIILPKGVEKLGHGAFIHCLGAEHVFVPNTVKEIGVGVFGGCSYVYMEVGNSRYISGEGCLFDQQTKTILWGAGDCTYPTDTKIIGESAFYKQDSLFVRVPQSVKVIDVDAYQYCEDLQYIILPDGIERIKKDAFFGCKDLKEINLPKDILLDQDCFYDCENLTIKYAGSSRDWRYRNEYLGCLSIKVECLG